MGRTTEHPKLMRAQFSTTPAGNQSAAAACHTTRQHCRCDKISE